jgi:hypothetical protein
MVRIRESDDTAYSSTLKMEAACSSKTPVSIYKITGCYIPEDHKSWKLMPWEPHLLIFTPVVINFTLSRCFLVDIDLCHPYVTIPSGCHPCRWLALCIILFSKFSIVIWVSEFWVVCMKYIILRLQNNDFFFCLVGMRISYPDWLISLYKQNNGE